MLKKSHFAFLKLNLLNIPSISFGSLSLFNSLQAISSLTYKRTPIAFRFLSNLNGFE